MQQNRIVMPDKGQLHLIGELFEKFNNDKPDCRFEDYIEEHWNDDVRSNEGTTNITKKVLEEIIDGCKYVDFYVPSMYNLTITYLTSEGKGVYMSHTIPIPLSRTILHTQEWDKRKSDEYEPNVVDDPDCFYYKINTNTKTIVDWVPDDSIIIFVGFDFHNGKNYEWDFRDSANDINRKIEAIKNKKYVEVEMAL